LPPGEDPGDIIHGYMRMIWGRASLTLSAGYPDTASGVSVATRPSSRALAGTRLVGQQLGQGDPQRAGDRPEVEDGHVALAALDGPEEGAVQPAATGQLPLGQAQALPPPPHLLPVSITLLPHFQLWTPTRLLRSPPDFPPAGCRR